MLWIENGYRHASEIICSWAFVFECIVSKMSLCSFVSVYSGESIAGKAKGEMPFSKGFSVCRHKFVKLVGISLWQWSARAVCCLGGVNHCVGEGGGWRIQQAKNPLRAFSLLLLPDCVFEDTSDGCLSRWGWFECYIRIVKLKSLYIAHYS